MKYRKFQGTMISWQGLFREAAEFATTLGPAAVHSISHSCCSSKGIVVVWYRDGVPAPEPGYVDLVMKFFFKRGIGSIVAGNPVPVVPCRIDGAHSAWPKGGIPRPRKVTLKIGEPISFGDRERGEESAAQIAAELEQIVRKL